MAEMLTPRDVDKVLSLLRRVYAAIVIDMSSYLNDINLGVPRRQRRRSSRSSPTTRRRSTTRSPWPTRSGRSATRRRRSAISSTGPTRPAASSPIDLERALGRVPEHRVVSDGRLVVQSNNEGVPFVLASPEAPISQDIMRVAGEILDSGRVPAAAGAVLRQRCPTRDPSASSTPGSAA